MITYINIVIIIIIICIHYNNYNYNIIGYKLNPQEIVELYML